MTKVEIYTTAYCPYCIRAKSLLEKKGVTYTEYKVDHDNALYEEMIERAKRTSVPQIFINDFHVGGCDDMFILDISDELDALLFPDKEDNK
ncbi:MAG: glutaredoxin 3 [Gammaproteobacteria bacterium]|nr:glutaredoxin 3 [Gammaproteobacteria bacterium]